MLLLEVPARVNQEVLTFAKSLMVEVPSLRVVRDRRRRSLARQLLDFARAYVPFLTS
jgi:hypothetical protein